MCSPRKDGLAGALAGTFCHLHVKSGFSYGLGTATPEELVEGAADMGYRSLALTDRDGLYGADLLVKSAKHGCRDAEKDRCLNCVANAATRSCGGAGQESRRLRARVGPRRGSCAWLSLRPGRAPASSTRSRCHRIATPESRPASR